MVRYMAEAPKPPNPSNTLTHPKHPPTARAHAHSQHLATRFDYLDFVLTHSDLRLSQAVVDQLWSVFVAHPAHGGDRAKFYAWLTRAADQRDKVLKSRELITHLFQEKLCKLDVQTE